MDISMNITNLLNSGITVNEYLYLRNLYVKQEDKIIDLYKLIESISEDSLQNRGFIKITDNEIVLRNKGIELFEKKDLFYKFLSTFPIKTPSGRYLSPSKVEGLAVEKLKKKWDSLFKNKEDYQIKAIEVLEAEMKWRIKSRNMEYMHAMEAWLNQGDFEKYEYLLEDSKKDNNEKWM